MCLISITGDRFVTYAIEGEANSGVICLIGAAARLGQPGDLVIIIAFAHITYEQTRDWITTKICVLKPTISLFNCF
jgi:aspartate 1-decarboxylase